MPHHHAPARFDRDESLRSGQLTLGDLGTPLSEVTFVVVDLETSGSTDITEIGAVKLRGGEVLGEFSTLVRPVDSVISPFVERLTGITNSMVAGAPELAAVLPAFLEFARGSVLVAHNAGFDVGYLKAACGRLDYHWPEPQVLDTVRLARQVVPRGEVVNHKLGTLAAHFGTAVAPDHRALSDARATGEILHHLFDRFGSYGITTLEELSCIKPAGWTRRRTKLHLAKDVPHGPGVYMFLDGSRRVLYIGVSGDMRTRVRSYFSAGETRGRMAEMITAAQEVATVPCDTHLEAQVREVRLIAEHAPPYNRRSKNPERRTWLRLTDDPYPRLAVSRTPPVTDVDAAARLGPFRTHRQAQQAKRILERLFPLKQCTRRPGSAGFAPCPSGELGQCGGPCAGVTDVEAYRSGISGVLDLLAADPADFVARCRERMLDLTAEERFETAADTRDAMTSLLGALAAEERRAHLTAVPEIVAAVPVADGGWEIALIRWGRLAGSAAVPAGLSPYPAIDALALTAEHVDPPAPGLPGTLAEETALIHRGLSDGRTRLVRTAAGWTEPISGFGRSHGRFGRLDRGPAV